MSVRQPFPTTSSGGGGTWGTITGLVADQTDLDNTRTSCIGISLDGGGSTITTGIKGYFVIPYSGTITGWYLAADVVGSLVIDVWKDTIVNMPPNVSDTITGSEKPTLSTQQINSDTTLTTWITTFSVGDVFVYNVDSASSVTKAALTIKILKD
jgi:hypothetical protein